MTRLVSTTKLNDNCFAFMAGEMHLLVHNLVYSSSSALEALLKSLINK